MPIDIYDLICSVVTFTWLAQCALERADQLAKLVSDNVHG